MERDAFPKQPVTQGKTANQTSSPLRGSLADAGRGGTLWPAEKATMANAASSATVNPYVERLKLATLLYGISLFMGWGVLYWGDVVLGGVLGPVFL